MYSVYHINIGTDDYMYHVFVHNIPNYYKNNKDERRCRDIKTQKIHEQGWKINVGHIYM